MNNIFFDVARYELRSESQVELDKVVQLMKDNPTLKIQINGHTDNSGKAADNIRLSENRAQSVTAYLTAKGIAAARLSSKAGVIRNPLPIIHCRRRAHNRRTELKVISR